MPPEETHFNGAVKPLNFPVLRWRVGGNRHHLNADGFAECSQFFAVAVVNSDPLNSEWRHSDQLFHEQNGVFRRFSVI